MMTDKQSKCIRFIEKMLPDIKFNGGDNGHLAYEFISTHLQAARDEQRRQEAIANKFIANLLDVPAELAVTSENARIARMGQHAAWSRECDAISNRRRHA